MAPSVNSDEHFPAHCGHLFAEPQADSIPDDDDGDSGAWDDALAVEN